MVFKQWKTDISSVNQLFKQFWTNYGLSYKTFADIGKDLKNGQGLRSFTNFASKSDIANLEKFNSDLQKGEKFSTAFRTNLSSSSTVVQKHAVAIARLRNQQKILGKQLDLNKITQKEYSTAMAENRAQMQALTARTQALTFSQKAAAVTSKVLGTALNMVVNVGIMLAINAIIAGITSFVNRQQENIEKAKEASEALKQETDSIDEYADKVVELRQKLDEGNLSLEESKNTRIELRDIQNELVEKYGEEAEGINLVTGKIEEQIDALYGLKKAKYDEAYRLNKEGYDAARKQIQSANLQIDPERVLAQGIGASSADDVEELRRFILEQFTQRGYKLGHWYGYDEDDDPMFRLSNIYKTSDAYTLDKDLSEIFGAIQEYAENGKIFRSFIKLLLVTLSLDIAE